MTPWRYDKQMCALEWVWLTLAISAVVLIGVRIWMFVA